MEADSKAPMLSVLGVDNGNEVWYNVCRTMDKEVES